MIGSFAGFDERKILDLSFVEALERMGMGRNDLSKYLSIPERIDVLI